MVLLPVHVISLQLEPNRRELELITLLLNATAPFYSDQDVLDEDDRSTRFPPHLGLDPFIGIGFDIHKLRYSKCWLENVQRITSWPSTFV